MAMAHKSEVHARVIVEGLKSETGFNQKQRASEHRHTPLTEGDRPVRLIDDSRNYGFPPPLPLHWLRVVSVYCNFSGAIFVLGPARKTTTDVGRRA